MNRNVDLKICILLLSDLWNDFIERCFKCYYYIRAIFSKVRKKIEDRPLLSFLLLFLFVGGGIYLLYIYINPNNKLSYYESLYSFFLFGTKGIKGVSDVDKITVAFLEGSNKFFTVSLPLTLTFYYFIYKEQKSISSNLAKGMLLWMYLSTAILNLVIGYYIIFNKMNLRNGFFSEKFFFPIVIWFILVVLSFLFFLALLNRLLMSLDISFLFKHTRKLMRKKIKEVYFTDVNLENNYECLNIYLESIFQSFEYAMEKGLDKLFERELKEWDSILLLLMDETPRGKKGNIITVNHLVDKSEKSTKHFIEFYSLVLKKHGDLIFKLASNNRLSKLNEVLVTFHSLEPNKVEALYPVFITALDEIVLKAYKQKNCPLKSLLEILNGIILSYKSSKDSSKEEQADNISKVIGVIYIYETVLREALETNNVKDITSVTYSLCGIFKEMDKKGEQVRPIGKTNEAKATSDRNNMLSSAAMISAMEISMTETKVNLDTSDNENMKKIILFILLQIALKAVEISHYKCLGQVIKRITTDFNALIIEKTFDDFRKGSGQIKSATFLEKDEKIQNAINSKKSMISRFRKDITFNNQSIDYCMQKLALLIYGQQFYVIKQNLTFTEFHKSYHEHPTSIDLSFVDMAYINYTLGKIKQVGNDYGLLFVKETDFEEEIKKKISVPV
ncbi:hypothetical protein [Bacillus cereus]|uniref:Uncharacterized protein n=1 Tax=Bacillus cereus TaxID=1396 RepID=A0A5B9I3W2_BACCE|nr:hypothetical protein [Bacillus cereus]QEF20290.1 hypothetical protein FRY47_28770 [Bacillus cereus]